MAAAHSLGTPLSTITLVVKELRKEIGSGSKHSKDLDLLVSQTKRCGEILKKDISKTNCRRQIFKCYKIRRFTD